MNSIVMETIPLSVLPLSLQFRHSGTAPEDPMYPEDAILRKEE